MYTMAKRWGDYQVSMAKNFYFNIKQWKIEKQSNSTVVPPCQCLSIFIHFLPFSPSCSINPLPILALLGLCKCKRHMMGHSNPAGSNRKISTTDYLLPGLTHGTTQGPSSAPATNRRFRPARGSGSCSCNKPAVCLPLARPHLSSTELCHIPGQHVGTWGAPPETRRSETAGGKMFDDSMNGRQNSFLSVPWWHSVWDCVALWLDSDGILLEYSPIPAPLQHVTFEKELLTDCGTNSHTNLFLVRWPFPSTFLKKKRENRQVSHTHTRPE